MDKLFGASSNINFNTAASTSSSTAPAATDTKSSESTSFLSSFASTFSSFTPSESPTPPPPPPPPPPHTSQTSTMASFLPTQAQGFMDMVRGGANAVGLPLPAATSSSSSSTSAAPSSSPPEWTCGLSYAQRFQIFLMLGCGSVSLYFAAIFIFLPLILLAPSKFAATFTFGSLLWLAAFAILRGPRTTLMMLLQRDKLLFTSAYIGSICLTLWSTLIVQSYFLVLLAVIIQIVAAVWYSSSYIPGGTAAAGALGRMCLSGVRGIARSITGR